MRHAIKRSKDVEMDKLSAKNQLISEVRKLRENIKKKKREVVEV
jgi:hypothetical protein